MGKSKKTKKTETIENINADENRVSLKVNNTQPTESEVQLPSKLNKTSRKKKVKSLELENVITTELGAEELINHNENSVSLETSNKKTTEELIKENEVNTELRVEENINSDINTVSVEVSNEPTTELEQFQYGKIKITKKKKNVNWNNEIDKEYIIDANIDEDEDALLLEIPILQTTREIDHFPSKDEAWEDEINNELRELSLQSLKKYDDNNNYNGNKVQNINSEFSLLFDDDDDDLSDNRIIQRVNEVNYKKKEKSNTEYAKEVHLPKPNIAVAYSDLRRSSREKKAPQRLIYEI